MIFIHGVPPRVKRNENTGFLVGEKIKPSREENRYSRLSQTGLGLLAFGFLLQIVSNFI
ncbi:hypothetical protein ES705_37040 [subsurface metagenome]